MNPATYSALFLAFFFVPLAVFSVVAVLARPIDGGTQHASELDDYLISSRDVKHSDYINSSAAYMLQVSTTFYFVFWGYNYGLSNIWYLVSWGLGLWCFSRFSSDLIQIRRQFETLPSYLAHGRRNFVRYVASGVTIASFLAIFYVESFFCVDFISKLANPGSDESPDSVWWVFFFILTGLTVTYSLFGGMRRVVITDRWQISFAYVCISIILGYLIQRSFAVSPISAVCVALLIALVFGALFWCNRGHRNRFIVQISVLAGLLIVLVVAYVSFRRPDLANPGDVMIAGPFRQVSERWGWVTLLGFTIINVLWQFCDNSNYQRIASLDLSQDLRDATRDLRGLISRLIWVSPLTWGLGIVLGIAIRTAGISVPQTGGEYIALLASIKDAALHGDLFALTAVLALSAALTSIMMETVDGALIACAQSFIRDISGDERLSTGRIAAISATAFLFVISLAIVHRALGGASILTVMAGAYSAMVVLALPAIIKMSGRTVPDWAAATGILFGFCMSWVATFGPISSLPNNIKLVLPFFAGPLGSVIPLLPWLVSKRP
jgi:Na+/proline symporter